MADVIEIGRCGRFSLEEVTTLLPVVRRVTERCQRRVAEMHAEQGPLAVEEHEQQLNAVFQLWAEQITRLGGKARGMWLVDFDNGEGYFCWRYPEASITHSHGYDEGFRGRTPLEA